MQLDRATVETSLRQVEKVQVRVGSESSQLGVRDKTPESCGWCLWCRRLGIGLLMRPPAPRAELHFRPKTEAGGWPGKENRSQALVPRERGAFPPRFSAFHVSGAAECRKQRLRGMESMCDARAMQPSFSVVGIQCGA